MLGLLIVVVIVLIAFGWGWSFYADSGKRSSQIIFVDYYAFGCSACGGAILGSLVMSYWLGRL